MLIRKTNTKLRVQEILKKVSEYDIYRFYLGKEFRTGEVFSSPLREDRNPSFMISSRGGKLHHVDFARPEYNGGCFDFVMQKYGVALIDALKIIVRDFKLGDVDVTREPTPIPAKEKTQNILQIMPKEFTLKELQYWSSYYQGLPELRAENVFSVGKIFLNKELYRLEDNEMVFAYLYEEKYWKVYRPLVKGPGKWLSTVPLAVMDGLEAIRNERNVVCTKSKKDKMVLNHLVACCSTQNESVNALSDDSITWLKGEVRGDVFINFDSDPPGVENSMKVTSKFGFKHVNVPYSFLDEGIKDFAELARVYGLRKVKELFKQKEII